MNKKFFAIAAAIFFVAIQLPADGLQMNDDDPLALPVVGAHQLRILSPTLLELTLINTEPANSTVTNWNFVSTNFQFDPPKFSEFEIAANGKKISATQIGFKRRPLYAPLAKRDLRIANEIYLRLAQAISDGETVQVKNPDEKLWPGNFDFTAAMNPLRYSPAIHVNQVGYVPNFPKIADVGFYLGNLGEMDIAATNFFLADAATGKKVFEGRLKWSPEKGWNYSPPPYQEVFEADFTAFTNSGEYKIVVPGLGASFPFFIDDGAAMALARTYALGLYEQRCGTSNSLPFTRFTHNACHTAPASVPVPENVFSNTWKIIAMYGAQIDRDNSPQVAPLLTNEMSQLFPFIRKGKIDVSGGHHDAGDYSKYTINSAQFIHNLLFAVDSMPGVASLDNLGIPESSDGISDVMQEAKWEADFLAKMQDSDGGFYFLVYPRDREYEGNVLPDEGDPQVVWPKTTSVTAAAVAALAECASSPLFKKTYPVEAKNYLAEAELGWIFLTNAIAKYGKHGAYQKITPYGDSFADDDELAWAACEMFLATGDQNIHQLFKSWFPDPTDPKTFLWGWWRLYESYGNAIRDYAFAARSGRLPLSALDTNYLAQCESEIIAAGDDDLKWSEDCAYGTSFPTENKRFRNAGWYFSSAQAFNMTVAYQILPKPEYLDAILRNLNYEAGCNPVNVCYITGLGWKRQREIVDQYSQNDRRVLPKSGIPIGNVQSGFGWLWDYGTELGKLCFPPDGSWSNPFPFYDRWGDSFNTQTEATSSDIARSLATAAFLAALTPLKTQQWKFANAEIVKMPAKNDSQISVVLKCPTLDLSKAQIVWEAENQEPKFGTNFIFTPTGETNWIEAEAQLPDGRRVFAATNFAQ
jgi:hypothetical protein